MPRLPTVKPHQVIRALERADFQIDHQTGSHVVLWRASDNRRVVVPWHDRDLGRGLTLRIIKSAGLTREQFIQLLK
ncbi:MAG: type II toxin-antitoxin system HicA family toxin [Anaerolineae bacterium]|jgi:predicted RNA binding protein YcfA (HicA-like mRNA interferase family)|nr:type II toxin-antitoxin system HicA family toxin [Anaerolineae bacterium]MDH7472883.1 type II toxin-antitoxin system HicA family toxin [Anaerolineae bacterium]